jgi:hypothetical protein
MEFMQNRKVWIFSLFFGLIVLLSGCFNVKPTEIKVVFGNAVWNRFMPMDATFEIKKVNTVYEIAVSLSVVEGFELEEVPLEIVLTAPDGQQNIVQRTLLIKREGNYTGKVHENIRTTERVIYPSKQFSQAGTYSVYIQNLTQYYELDKVESLSFIVRPAEKVKEEK